MPCSDGGPSVYDDNTELKRRLDKVTRLLCSLTATLPAKYLKDPELAVWLQEHAEADKKRKQQEADARAAHRRALANDIKRLQKQLDTFEDT